MDLRQQQIDALEMAVEYLDKLIPSMEQVISEIKGQMQEDTIDFLIQIIDGLNFMFETYNATKDLISSKGSVFNDEALEEVVNRLSDGFSKKDYVKIAMELETSIVPFLQGLREAIVPVLES